LFPFCVFPYLHILFNALRPLLNAGSFSGTPDIFKELLIPGSSSSPSFFSSRNSWGLGQTSSLGLPDVAFGLNLHLLAQKGRHLRSFCFLPFVAISPFYEGAQRHFPGLPRSLLPSRFLQLLIVSGRATDFDRLFTSNLLCLFQTTPSGALDSALPPVLLSIRHFPRPVPIHPVRIASAFFFLFPFRSDPLCCIIGVMGQWPLPPSVLNFFLVTMAPHLDLFVSMPPLLPSIR